MFYFHAARAFTVCIPAGSRTVRPLHAFAGAGPRPHSPERAVEPLSLDGGVGGDRSTYLPDMTLLVNSPPITIDLRLKARQPAVSFSALLPKLLE